MSREDSGTRRHILDVVETMISEDGGNRIQISEVANRANVAVQTIYYHFESRGHLFAEAQASVYLKLIVPLHQFLSRAEVALEARDEEAFLRAVGENIAMAWSLGQIDGGWRITKLLMDVWSHPKTRRSFCNSIDVQVDRWIGAIESSQGLGWVPDDLDVMALVASCWAGSIGQAIFSGSTRIQSSPESIRDYFMRIVAKDPAALGHFGSAGPASRALED